MTGVNSEPSGVTDLIESNPVTNPVLNNPYDPPNRHWRLDRNLRAIDAQPLTGRRPSLALLPVPRARNKSANLEFNLGDADHALPSNVN